MSNAEFHTVQRGDTLSKIAKQHGTTVRDLSNLNGITDPNRINVGEKIALNREAVCKVGFQFLDRDRNPMRDTKVRIEYCGKVKEINTGNNGRVPDIVTDSPSDTVKVWIQRAEGGWKLITEVVSDWGNKLVTLTSPKIRIEASTHPHPRAANGQPKKDKSPVPTNAARNDTLRRKTSTPAETKGQGTLQSTYGDDKGIKIEEKKDAQGLPVAKATNDQPELEFLGGYTGEEIIESDLKDAAIAIGCEVAVIKAVAEVETRKAPFDKHNRPTILYERHVFARNTRPKGKYDDENPDISGHKKPYKQPNDENKKLVKAGTLNSYDLYGNSYPRLSKAYALDKEAALKACSWGKFQILGENYRAAGFASVLEFTRAMGMSEREHLKAFAKFVVAQPSLRKAAINKDWTTFARIYNGPSYKKYNYDSKMANAYKKHSQS